VHRRAPKEGAGRGVAAAFRREERALSHDLERAGAPLQPIAMFLDLFYGLRDEGVPVALQEWMTLLEALKRGMHGSSLLRFYHLARACLVKSETFFDAYDRVFARVFHGVEGSLDVTDEILQWLKDPKNFPNLSPEELAAL